MDARAATDCVLKPYGEVVWSDAAVLELSGANYSARDGGKRAVHRGELE